MDKGTIAAIAAAPVLGLVAAFALLPGEKINVVIEETGTELDYVDEPKIGQEFLSVTPDGGVNYLVHVKTKDGGVETRKTVAGCVRRPAKAPVDTCRMLVGGSPRDQGDLNRFPKEDAVGTGCEPVACTVWSGDDPDEQESKRVSDFIGKR